MKEILLNLQSIIKESKYLKYVNKKAVIISEIETDIANIPITMFPAVMIMPGGEDGSGSETIDSLRMKKNVEIIIANHYLKEDTVLFGDKRNIGILNH